MGNGLIRADATSTADKTEITFSSNHERCKFLMGFQIHVPVSCFVISVYYFPEKGSEKVFWGEKLKELASLGPFPSICIECRS